MPAWKKVLSLVGFPVEEKHYGAHLSPWVSSALVMATLGVFWAGDGARSAFALNPTEPGRAMGANFLTYALAHADTYHLISNLLFVWPFLDNVEDVLGHGRFLFFVAVSAVVSSLLHFALEPRLLPLVGLSGVCLAIMTFYASTFPKNRFLMAVPLVGLLFHTQRLRIRAWTLLGYFALFEFLGAFGQASGASRKLPRIDSRRARSESRFGLASRYVKHPVVVGLQYGDEGKGKITDVLAKQADWVLRFNGGSNAGHTIWLNGKKLVTHAVPSGVLYPHVKNFIGAGCVLNPQALKKELDELAGAGAGLGPDRLQIDYRAHVTLPIHLALDGAREAGAGGIGTTKKGIGPTYTTKTDRTGVRVGQLDAPDIADRVRFLLKTFNPILCDLGLEESSERENLELVELARQLVAPHLSRDPAPFYDLAKKSRCVLEGGQGILLDIDHGTYPYVTSSNTIPAYASIGTPFPSSRLGFIFGVAKAYLTRVGQGPMATELHDETGNRIRERGHEFGATTGRPRRTGWLNADELKLAVRLSDCSGIVLTKSDIRSGEAKIRALFDGKLVEFEGWPHVTDGDKLHPKAEAYVQAIEAHVGIPVVALGTGADRADLHWRRPMADFWNSDVSS